MSKLGFGIEADFVPERLGMETIAEIFSKRPNAKPGTLNWVEVQGSFLDYLS
jgi:hypothetical protein